MYKFEKYLLNTLLSLYGDCKTRFRHKIFLHEYRSWNIKFSHKFYKNKIELPNRKIFAINSRQSVVFLAPYCIM